MKNGDLAIWGSEEKFKPSSAVFATVKDPDFYTEIVVICYAIDFFDDPKVGYRATEKNHEITIAANTSSVVFGDARWHKR